MTKKPQTTTQDDTTDVGTFSEGQAKTVRKIIQGIGKRSLPAYGGAAGYERLPGDR